MQDEVRFVALVGRDQLRERLDRVVEEGLDVVQQGAAPGLRVGVGAGQPGGPGLHAQHRYGYRFLPELHPLLDEGVALARRLHALDPAAGTGPLTRALFDRASALTAALRYTDAGAEFREARALRAARR